MATFNGTTGNDELVGTGLEDAIDGLAGDDTLLGGDAGDTLNGGTGNDHLRGDGGDDRMYGGEGNDVFYDWYQEVGADLFDGGAGIDTLVASGVINLSAGTATGNGADTLVGIDNVIGLLWSDVITGDVQANSLWGGGGSDLLDGGRGDDTIIGGSGDDTLAGGAGDDILMGRYQPLTAALGVDLDLLPVEDNGYFDLDIDTATFRGVYADYTISFDAASGFYEVIDKVAGRDGIDHLKHIGQVQFSDRLFLLTPDPAIRGTLYPDLLVGTAGDDVIIALTGHDTLVGLAGNDMLTGDRWDDLFDPGTGQDTIQGGDGDDTVSYAGAIDSVLIDLGAGTVTEGPGAAQSDTLADVENAEGSAFGDVLIGNDASQRLDGGGGNDEVYGGVGLDTLLGGLGDDLLAGGVGNDTVEGGEGNDTLQLSGPLSRYVFAYDSVSGAYFVSDMDANRDRNDQFTGIEFVQFQDTLVGVAELDLQTAGTPGMDTLDGTPQNDTLAGFDGFNFLNGFDGDDVLVGGKDWNYFEGGNGNDLIVGDGIAAGGSGNDTITSTYVAGGEGDDTLDGQIADYTGAASAVDVDLQSGTATGEGNDVLATGFVELWGSAFDDFLKGSTGDEKLLGKSGDDTFYASGGHDIIEGDDGVDTLVLSGNLADYRLVTGSEYGTSIRDSVDARDGETFAASSVEYLQFADGTLPLAQFLRQFTPGTEGDDVFAGTAQYDQFLGGLGDDSVDGADGDDWLEGNAGNDTLLGGAGYDFLRDDDGNDVVSAGVGDDILANGMGDDTIGGGDGWDWLYVGADYDPLIFANPGVFVNLESGLGWGYLGNDVISGIEAVRGWYDDDALTGDGLANVLVGDRGGDSLAGGEGNDTLSGGEGADWLEGGAGDDRVDGSDGYSTPGDGSADDIASYANAISGVVVHLGEHYETELAFGSATGGAGNDTLIGIEHLVGSAFSDSLIGSRADNLLAGDAGNDTLDGGAGDDTFVPGTGSNAVSGGWGHDVADYSELDVALNVDLAIGRVNHGADQDTLSGIEEVRGTVLADLFSGGPASIWFIGGAGNDALAGGAGDDRLDGGDDNDSVIGGEGWDSMSGGAGDDTMDGGGGNDTLNAGSGMDTASFVSAAGAVIANLAAGTSTGTGQDVLFGFENLTGGAFNDRLSGDAGANRIIGGKGNDTIAGGAGDDSVHFSGAFAQYVVGFNSATATFTVTDKVAGRDGVDVISGMELFVFSDVSKSNIEMVPPLLGTVGNDLFTGSSGNDSFSGLAGNDTLNGAGGNDRLDGGTGNDRLDGGTGADSLLGGAGDDIYVVDDAGDTVSETVAEGLDTVTSSVGYTLGGAVENLTLAGQAAISGTGNELDNVLTGNAAANVLSGADGNDLLDGGAGPDTLSGGSGNDTYVVDSAADVIAELQDAGIDTVKAAVGFSLQGLEVENLFLNGSLAIGGDGNAMNNMLVGNGAANLLSGLDGDDELNGGAGNDTLVGGDGNDIYTVDAAGDLVVELEGEGTDLVNVAFTLTGTHTLGANVENATVTAAGILATHIVGNALDNHLIGHAGANTLNGGAGNDTLNGGLGTDSLIGGAGDDSYVVNVATDVINETVVGSGGTDTVNVAFTAAGTYLLSLNVENAFVSGGVAGINVTGNALDNALTGNALNNLLNGAAGNDTLTGAGGIDVIDGGLGTDQVIVLGAYADYLVTRTNAADTVLDASNGERVTFRNVELVQFTDGARTMGAIWGNTPTAFSDMIEGTAGNDTIDGLAGNDTLRGLAGNDTYVVDVPGDMVVELEGEGTDLVNVAFTLAGTHTMGANVENATVTSAGILAAHIVGNALDNHLIGNAGANNLNGGEGNDTLDGGLGSDILVGGAGDDSYVVNVATDVINETVAGSGGTDTVNVAFTAAGSYLLSLNVENAFVSGVAAGINVTGNASNNVITGSALNNLLNGAAGDDLLAGAGGIDVIDGGLGADLVTVLGAFGDYLVTRTNATDTVLAHANNGERVTIRNVELVQFTDGARNMGAIWGNTPTAFNDMVEGTDGNDTINGLAGNDTLSGLAGNDTLIGGSGIDSLAGGEGDDVYFLDVAGETVVELLDQGTDLVNLGFTLAGTHTLAAHVENATVTAAGILAVHIVGNALDNHLIGNAGANNLNGGEGNDTLDGGLGSDILVGGAGDDSYVANVATDLINETVVGSGGTDTVNVAFTAAGAYLLSLNVENAFVSGVAAGINVTGNASNNVITGNAWNNLLNGAAGDDLLTGAGGIDAIDGGLGTDVVTVLGAFGDYLVTRSNAADTVLAHASNGERVTIRNVELVQFTDGARNMGAIWGNTPTAFSDMVEGTDGNDTINGLAGNDTLSGLAGDDTYVVDAPGDLVVELETEGTDLVNVAFTLAGTHTLGANVENATVTSAGILAVHIVGNALDNRLIGNAGANNLNGGEGNDTLDGGLGSDVLTGGAGDDSYVVNVATDVINETVVGSGGTDTVNVAFTAAGGYVLSLNVENAFVSGAAAGVSVTGNASNNAITGNALNNMLSGAAGDDVFAGAGGIDVIDGGLGADQVTVLGAFGDYVVTRPNATDTVLAHLSSGERVTLRNVELVQFTDGARDMGAVWGNTPTAFSDMIEGTDGNDTINGLAGNDTLRGLAGDDTYVVDAPGDLVVELEGEGTDLVNVAFILAGTHTLGANVDNATVTSAGILAVHVVGNALNNRLIGNAGANNLNGGEGNDTLDGGLGSDVLTGGAGDDSYVVNVATDVINETVVGSGGTDTVNVAFTAAGAYLLSLNVENAFVSGVAAGINITGNASNNVISGNAWNNLLNGAAGDDLLTGAGGIDVIDGGLGADLVTVLGAFGDYLVTRTASDTVLAHASSGERVTLRNVELVQFTDGARDMGAVWGNTPTAFSDVIEGTDGNDTINGLAGNDTLSGLAGNDTLIGGFGIDSLAGGEGDDVYFLDEAGDTVVELLDQGTDLVNLGFTLAGTHTLAAHVENATVTAAGILAFHIVGNDMDNHLIGNAGANNLNGAAGNDTLDGGSGADTLTGGAGQDFFRFSTVLVSNVDRINDFVVADDSFELDSALFATLAEGALDVAAFQSGATSVASSAAVRIVLNTGTGALLYDQDGAGGAAAVQFATIVTAGLVGSISASDFFVI